MDGSSLDLVPKATTIVSNVIIHENPREERNNVGEEKGSKNSPNIDRSEESFIIYNHFIDFRVVAKHLSSYIWVNDTIYNYHNTVIIHVQILC